jgi:hypothetical protein
VEDQENQENSAKTHANMRDQSSAVDLWGDRCWGLSKPSLGHWSPAGKQKGDLFLVRGNISWRPTTQ